MAASKGNKYAAKDREVRRKLMELAGENPQMLHDACFKVLENASKGDLPSFLAMRDTIDGKPAQAVHVTGELDAREPRQLSNAELERELSTVRGALRGTIATASVADSPDPVH